MAQGKGILQPHHLLDELENIIGEDEGKNSLSDGPFSEVLKSAQVYQYSPQFISVKIIIVLLTRKRLKMVFMLSIIF